MSAALGGRGRRPTPTNRSRQQLQREKALQFAAQQKSGPGMSELPPEQKLAMPPPQPVRQPVATVKPVPAVEVPTVKVETVVVNHDPAPVEETTPIAIELEKPEAESLV